MNLDARISTGLPGHPKTKKLINNLGQAGAWNLICLFLWAAQNKPDGNLAGVSDEDIELASDWFGDEGAFVLALKKAKFLDGESGTYSIHDWHDHNPWAAGAEARSDKARLGGLVSKYGKEKGNAMFHAYQARRQLGVEDNPTTSSSDSTVSQLTVELKPQSSSTPSPSPSPSPKQKTIGRSGDPTYTESFLIAWGKYPKRAGNNPKPKAFKAWNARKQAGCTDLEMTDGVMRYAKWCHLGGKVGTEFVMHAATFFGPDKHFTADWDFIPSGPAPRPGAPGAAGNPQTHEAWIQLRACVRDNKAPSDPSLLEAFRSIGGHGLMQMNSEDIDKRRSAFDSAYLRASSKPTQRVADFASGLLKTVETA